MSHIDVHQAKSRLEELIEQAAHGEDVIITKSNQPVGRLSGVTGKRRRQFGSVKGAIWMSDDFDEPLEDFRAALVPASAGRGPTGHDRLLG